jgi:hypothetical protein
LLLDRVLHVTDAHIPFFTSDQLPEYRLGCLKATSRAEFSCPGFGPHEHFTTQYLGQLMGFSA